MKRILLFGVGLIAFGLVFAGLPSALTPTASAQVAQRVAAQTPSDLSAQRRLRRRATPIYIYGHRPLSPNAKRACVDWYAQEYRPSGTVIVPRMSCRWIDG